MAEPGDLNAQPQRDRQMTEIQSSTEQSVTRQDVTRLGIKQVIIDSLGLEGMSADDIGDDESLFGEEGLGLDSIDALELIVVFEKDYGVTIDSEDIDPETFATVARLEEFILSLKSASGEAS